MKHTVLYLSLLSILLFPLSASAKATAKENADLARWKANTERYLAKVAADSTWLFSRLQMYWSTHATDVYVNSERFDHVGGDCAPVPTVKFNGTRGTESSYNRPELDNVIPYDDDAQGDVTYINRGHRQDGESASLKNRMQHQRPQPADTRHRPRRLARLQGYR